MIGESIDWGPCDTYRLVQREVFVTGSFAQLIETTRELLKEVSRAASRRSSGRSGWTRM